MHQKGSVCSLTENVTGLIQTVSKDDANLLLAVHWMFFSAFFFLLPFIIPEFSVDAEKDVAPLILTHLHNKKENKD